MLDAPPPSMRLKHEVMKTVLGDKVPGTTRTNAQTPGRIRYGQKVDPVVVFFLKSTQQDLIGERMTTV